MVANTIILGGGITGLAVAYELLKRGGRVSIIEKEVDIGGLAKCISWRGMPLDLGPHIYHTPDRDIQTYWEIEFGDLLIKKDHVAKNFKDGKFYSYPISQQMLDQLPTEVGEKVRSELEGLSELSSSHAKSYSEFIQGLAGKTLQQMFFVDYPEKLWGLPVDELDPNWAPKRIRIREHDLPFYGDQFSAVGKCGSGSIVGALRSKIEELGGEIICESKIVGVEISSSSNGSYLSRINTQFGTIACENDNVINTLSVSVFSQLMNIDSKLSYRGVRLCYLYVDSPDVLPTGVDFVYFDEEDYRFHRISDQNKFVGEPCAYSTVLCCEVAFSSGDAVDLMGDDEFCALVSADFKKLPWVRSDITIIDAHSKKLPEVYPLYKIGYKQHLNQYLSKLENIQNLYTVGSLAEFAYSDLQILFRKAIDLADRLSDKTMKLNGALKKKRAVGKNNFRIKDIEVGSNQLPFLIAEIGLNHNGDLELARRLVDASIEAGFDAVKFQSYKAKNRVAEFGRTSQLIEKIVDSEETDYQMLTKYELTDTETSELFNYCDEKQVKVFSAAFDLESLRILEALDCACYKIASFDLNNYPLLEKLSATGKPLILSTGMADLGAVCDSVEFLQEKGVEELAVLQCTSVYPCPPGEINLRVMDTYKQCFNNIPVGLSDHFSGSAVSLAAVARGASIIEKHVTLDRNMEGPDHTLSLEPAEMVQFVSDVRTVCKALGSPIKRVQPSEQKMKLRFSKTLHVTRDLRRGQIVTEDVVTLKGPGYGLGPRYYDFVLGLPVVQDVKADEPLTWNHFSQASAND